MKIISSTQLKELDKYTIAKEPVASIDLMERAAEELTRAITHRWDTSFHIVVFAGPGNNGGDALAVARMLSKQNYHVEVFLFNTKGKLSEECQTNLERLKECGSVYFTEVSTQFDPPVLTERHLVVDGLFGSGLNKPLNGGFAAVVKYINASKAQVVAIDVPSGLMCEDNTYNIRQNMIRADVTLSIQLPKLSFLFPENEDIVGEWQLLDIQLKKDFIDTAQSPYYITEEEEIRSLIKPRKRFAHKGTFGHALLIAGSYGMAGASILLGVPFLRHGEGKDARHLRARRGQEVEALKAVVEQILALQIRDIRRIPRLILLRCGDDRVAAGRVDGAQPRGNGQKLGDRHVAAWRKGILAAAVEYAVFIGRDDRGGEPVAVFHVGKLALVDAKQHKRGAVFARRLLLRGSGGILRGLLAVRKGADAQRKRERRDKQRKAELHGVCSLFLTFSEFCGITGLKCSARRR